MIKSWLKKNLITFQNPPDKELSGQAPKISIALGMTQNPPPPWSFSKTNTMTIQFSNKSANVTKTAAWTSPRLVCSQNNWLFFYSNFPAFFRKNGAETGPPQEWPVHRGGRVRAVVVRLVFNSHYYFTQSFCLPLLILTPNFLSPNSYTI